MECRIAMRHSYLLFIQNFTFVPPLQSGCSEARLSRYVRDVETGSSNLPTPTLLCPRFNVKYFNFINRFIELNNLIFRYLHPSSVKAMFENC